MCSKRVIKLEELRSHCQKCSLIKLCLPMGLEEGDFNKLDSIIQRRRGIEKGEYLYRIGEPFSSVFAIRTGSLKTFITNQEGQEQIISFHLPGELIGLEAISGETHTCSAQALESTSVCEIPFERLESLSAQIPGLQHHLFSLMSEEMQHDHCHLSILAKSSVESRLANFLVEISDRFKNRGFSATEFNLSMSRNDIANALGMAVETISRLFTQFQDHGLLHVERKSIKILDLDRLQGMSSGCAPEPDIPSEHSPRTSSN